MSDAQYNGGETIMLAIPIKLAEGDHFGRTLGEECAMDMFSLLLAESWPESLANAAADNWMWTVGGTIAITAITFGSLRRVVTGCARERSRREIAAFIAEGSMTPEQGERLMKAREPICE